MTKCALEEKRSCDLQKTDKPVERQLLVDVVVLGDVGHSPRMNYHALSFANEGFKVNIFGYSGSKPQEEILSHPNIKIVSLRNTPKCFKYFPSLIRFVIRVLWQSVFLWTSLLFNKHPDCLILQNPPSVPALPVCWLFCSLFRSKLILDWHNYGNTILAMALGRKHPLVSIYKFIEKFFGKLAFHGLCVSKAMKEDLANNWAIDNVTVHYDKPPARFKPITIEDKHDLFMKLSSELAFLAAGTPDKTAFTERFSNGRVCFCEDRPALLVSSTSWTEDEDFSVLIRALSIYDETAREAPNQYPLLIVIVTGKGPLKEFYMDQAKLCNWQLVQLETVWLDAADYPRLLAAADMGVSLHTSSSGLDLPMKVVDMFGSGLPVIARYYNTITELVLNNVTGITFNSDDELADRLISWFNGFPHSATYKARSQKLRDNVLQFRKTGWHELWKCNVLPLLK